MQAPSIALMQVVSAQSLLQECKPMTTASEIRTWLIQTLSEKGITVAEWARRSRVAASTIHRAMKDDYPFVTSSSTLAKLATGADVSMPDSFRSGPIMAGAEFLPIRYEVGAGNWQEVSDAQMFIGSGPVSADPAYTGFPQWLERVQGDSMDREYRQNELVHVVDAIALGYVAQHGDHVILVRRRNDGSEMERTIKEVVRTPSGAVEFWPRSTNPRWNRPVVMSDGHWQDETLEVEVAGLVLGSYKPRRS